MAADEVMKGYKGIFESKTFRSRVMTYPMRRDTEIRSAALIRPYISRKRNLADSKLVFQVSKYARV